MSLIVEELVAKCGNKENIILKIIPHIIEKGYKPVIAQAKQKFFEDLGAKVPLESAYEWDDRDRRRVLGANYRRIRSRGRSRGRSRDDIEGVETPLTGDIFKTPDGKGLLYIMQTNYDSQPYRFLGESDENTWDQLVMGYIGDLSGVHHLLEFEKTVNEAISSEIKEMKWNSTVNSNITLQELASDKKIKYTSLSSIPEEHYQYASKLENMMNRNIALYVKSSGSVLLEDIVKQFEDQDLVRGVINDLVVLNLLKKELVVICRKTSKQITRIKNKDVINTLSQNEVLCSCGTPIHEEIIEELISTEPIMNKMLDKSYWMSLKLINSLRKIDIPDEKIMLNVIDGPQETDALVDIDGKLLMFELKDDEFSMGHAYKLSGRIGYYKPDYAIIASTKGSEPDVKKYFERLEKENTQVIYADNLEDIDVVLNNILLEIRSREAKDIIDMYDPISSLGKPLVKLLSNEAGIK